MTTAETTELVAPDQLGGDIRWTLDGEPHGPSSRLVLAFAIELLPIVDDALVADLIEHLALSLVDRDDERRAARAVLSSALGLSNAQHAEIVRLRRRVADLLELRRQERPAAA